MHIITFWKKYYQYLTDPSCDLMQTHIQQKIWKKERVGKWGWVTTDFTWNSFFSVNVFLLFLSMTFLMELRTGCDASKVLENLHLCGNHQLFVKAHGTQLFLKNMILDTPVTPMAEAQQLPDSSYPWIHLLFKISFWLNIAIGFQKRPPYLS